MKAFVAGLAAVGVGFLGSQTSSIRPVVNPPVKPVGLQAHDSHAAVSLLGQFRSSISSFLFLRADLYLHNGVEMRPLSDIELKAGRKGVGGSAAEKEKLHDDSKIVTIIPPKEFDFRGVFGDVERSVASFKDMTGHSHNNPTQALPLFRLMTTLDPQFVQGWTTGAFIVMWDRRPGCVEKSLEYLQEGLKHNPKSIDILTQIAYSHLRDLSEIGYGGRHYDRALPYLLKAREIGLENIKFLSISEIEAFLENYRRLVVSLRELKRYDDMLGIAKEAVQVFPDDGPLNKHLRDAEALKKGQSIQVGKDEIKGPSEGL